MKCLTALALNALFVLLLFSAGKKADKNKQNNSSNHFDKSVCPMGIGSLNNVHGLFQRNDLRQVFTQQQDFKNGST